MAIGAKGDNSSQLTGNPSKEYICFHGSVVAIFSPSDTRIDFKVINGAFHVGSYFIERNPFIGITLNAGEHAEIHIFISVCSAAFFCRAARFITIANPFTICILGHPPFIAIRAPFFAAVTEIFHIKVFVIRAGVVSINVVTDFFKAAFISVIVED